MNDFDIKGIEKHRKQLKKNERAASQRGRPHHEKAYDDRRLSFEKRTKDEPLSFSGHKQVIEEPALQPAPSTPLSTGGAEEENTLSFKAVAEAKSDAAPKAAAPFAKSDFSPSEQQNNPDSPNRDEDAPKAPPVLKFDEASIEADSNAPVSVAVVEQKASDSEAERSARPAKEAKHAIAPAVEVLEFTFDEDYPSDEIYESASFEDTAVVEATANEKAEPIAKTAEKSSDGDEPLSDNGSAPVKEAAAATIEKQKPASRRPQRSASILSLFRGKDKSAKRTAEPPAVSNEIKNQSALKSATAAKNVKGDTIPELAHTAAPSSKENGAATDCASIEKAAASADSEANAVVALLPEMSSFDRTAFSDGIVLGEGIELPAAEKVPFGENIAAASTKSTKPVVEKIWFSKALEKILVPRFYAVLVLMLLLLGPLFTLKYYGEFCYLSDEGEEAPAQKVVWTAANSPREIAQKVVELKETDKVEVEEFGSTKMLTVIRSYPVTLTVDGVTETHHVLEHSVAELLGSLGVSLSEDDLLSHEYNHILSEGDEIVIQRVSYEHREAVEDVPYKTVIKNSPVLREGNENLAQTGVDGVAARVYRDKYVDGELVSSEIIEEEMIEKGRDEIIVTGDPTVPASTIDGTLYTDVEIVDGAPTDYEWVIEGAVCTAYSGKPGTFGASGMRLFQGFVAVNPDVIPYGTLMYIASDRFTYGWAIAGDCGTAMMEGYVDIDCYFETYNESAMFGKKALNVYVVKQLTQSELEEYAANGMFYGRVPASVSNEE